MPYSGPNDEALPANVKSLTKAQRSKWVSTWNSAYSNARNDDTGGGAADEEEAERIAFKIANGTIKNAEEPSFNSMEHFLSRLRELLRDKVNINDFNAAVRTARASAGGKGKAAARLVAQCEEHETPFAGCEMCDMAMPMATPPKLEKADERVDFRDADELGVTCGDCKFYQYGTCGLVEGEIGRMSVCNLFAPKAAVFTDSTGHQYSRLYMEAPQEFAEAPEWMPLLPKPGTYKHSKWGELTLSKARLSAFVKNFNDGIYGQQLPVDAEHEFKLSGAVGWIKEVRQNSDGSADARVEWTDRGTTLISGGGYRYVSPEWWEEWQQPETGKMFKDILIGAAITTRPFFKERALRPLVANEKGFYVAGDSDEDSYHGEGGDMPQNPATEDAAPTVQQFTELETRLAAETTAREAAEAGVAQMREQLSALQSANTRRSFTDEVMGRSDANNVRWFGDVEKHVSILTKMAEAFGPESDEVREYVEQQRSISTQMRNANIFSAVGSDAPGTPDLSAEAEISKRASQLVTEGKAQSFAEATVQVLDTDSALATRYANERNGK